MDHRCLAGATLLSAVLVTSWPSAALGQQVNVTGAGAVGVGTMSGGTINVGLTPAEAKALANATGQQLLKQLEAISARLSTNRAAEPVPAGVVHSFLAIVKGKHVPVAEWPATFAELTDRFRRAGTQIAAIPLTSQQVKELVDQADAARKAGRFDDAEQALKQADELALQDALKQQQQARDATRQAASVRATRASLAFARLERAQGAQLLEQAFDLRGSDADVGAHWWLVDAGDRWVTQGSLPQALRLFTRARDAAQAFALAQPNNLQWQRALSVSHGRIGEVQQAQGSLGAALHSFQAGLALDQRLAASDQTNAEWQRDLSISHERIGGVQRAQGNLGAALQSYQASMAIRETLAASDPGNAARQRDLSISHYKIGEVHLAQGNLAAALRIFDAGLVTRQKLAASDSGNAAWQRGLSISHEKIGGVQQAQGNLGAALQSYQAGMAIRQRLAASDPGNAEWQRDLSVSHEKVGNVQREQGNLGAALKSHQASMAIAQNLAATDPGNAEWQLDVVISCWRVYSVTPTDAVDARRGLLVQGLAVLKSLEASDKLPNRARGWPTIFSKAAAELK